MKFENFLTKTKDFLIKRITEFIGLLIIILSVSLLISLVSYSPNDPNFLIEKSVEVQNLMGFKGSMISDFLFQSIGLISYLIPVTLFFSGINIILKKNILIIIDNLFFCISYTIFGSLFFSYFKSQSFFLTVNGNGGFVGNFLSKSFIKSLIEINLTVSFYLLITGTFLIFLISTNFKISQVLTFIKFLNSVFRYKKLTKSEINTYSNEKNVQGHKQF